MVTKKRKAELKARASKDPSGEHKRAIEQMRSIKEQISETAELIKCLGKVATTEAGRENAAEAAEWLSDDVLRDLEGALENLELMVEDNPCVSVLQERLGIELDTAAF